MEVSVIGISHQTAPVAIREQFALPGELAALLLSEVKRDEQFSEALLLGTCNRTELYLVPPEGRDLRDAFVSLVARVKNSSPVCESCHFYQYDGSAAIRHLFRVAASLDSQLIGEDQILGQVKDAYRLAREAKTTGVIIDKLLHRVIRIGKRVRSETGLGTGAASLAQAAVELARQVLKSLAGKTMLVVGAGDTGRLAARNLVCCGVERVIVVNRTLAHANAVAETFAAQNACEKALTTLQPARVAVEAASLDNLHELLQQADVVISSTASPGIVLSCDELSPVLASRERPLLIVDIAVPRDADERLAGLDNVFLYNIDDLDDLIAANMQRREAEIPRVEAIIDDACCEFQKVYDMLQAAPVIRLLQQQFEAFRRELIGRHAGRFDEEGIRQLELLTKALGKKVLHHPISFLRRSAAERASLDQNTDLETFRRIFGID